MNLKQDLLPSNALKSERSLSLAAEFSEAILPEDIKTLWRPQEAAKRFLPFLAWGLHVDFWRDSLSDEAKRNLVSGSFEWHRREGTFGAIRRICETTFGETKVQAWYDYGGEPYGFKVFTEGRFGTPEDWEALQEAIWFAQALRDSLDGIEIRRTLTTDLYHGIALSKSGQKHIGLPPMEPKKGKIYTGCAIGRGGKKQLGLHHRSRITSSTKFGIAFVRGGMKTIELPESQKNLLEGESLWRI